MLVVHLFVSYAHVNLYHFFSSSLCQGLAAASACGSSWTFLFTVLHILSKLHYIVSMIDKNTRKLNRFFFLFFFFFLNYVQSMFILRHKLRS